MLIGVVLLLALFWFVKDPGEEKVADSSHAGSNTSSIAELPAADPPIAVGAADAGTKKPVLYGRGQISGRVTYAGLPPSPELLDTRADRRCRRIITEEERYRQRFQIDVKSRAVAGAVVWVAIDPSLEYRSPSQPVQLRVRKCWFHPETIALQVGQPLVAINDDPLGHTIHAFTVQTELKMTLPKKGARIERVFPGPDPDGTFKCEHHPWERGRIYVFSHPFFTMTDSAGRFTIKRLPGEGPWRVLASHPGLATTEMKEASGNVTLQLAEKAL